MKVCEINFGGEIGTRPAVIVKNGKDNCEVLKITTKAKASDYYSRFRLSGFSGVKGYVVTNSLYTVPKSRIKRYTSRLFDYEEKETFKRLNNYRKNGYLNRINID